MWLSLLAVCQIAILFCFINRAKILFGVTMSLTKHISQLPLQLCVVMLRSGQFYITGSITIMSDFKTDFLRGLSQHRSEPFCHLTSLSSCFMEYSPNGWRVSSLPGLWSDLKMEDKELVRWNRKTDGDWVPIDLGNAMVVLDFLLLDFFHMRDKFPFF